jgi:hypothetical protein
MRYEGSHVDTERLNSAKAAFTTRRVRLNEATMLLNEGISPSAGDLLLARVEKIGHHKRLELTNGRRARLFAGDEVLVSYGNRYAPNQFEAVVPDSMSPCHLAAAGGIAARILSKHGKMKDPTKLVPLGLLGDIKGRPLNLADFALPKLNRYPPRPFTLAVAGTAMDAGKTTTAASIVKGLTAAGRKVGAAKVTGTGAGGDLWFMKDAGADPVLDFVDAGFPSTYRVTPEQIEEIAILLINHLRNAAVDAIVFEVSDGLYQEETAGLLSSGVFRDLVDGVIFAASDAMGANAGVEWLWQRDLPVLALSGGLTSSPLAIREAQEAVGLAVLRLKALCDPSIAGILEALLANQLATQSVSLRAV